MGLELLGLRLRPGDHVCAFYRRPSERDDILIPFLADGLTAGDKCTCVVDSCAPSDVLARLEQSVATEPYLSASQLEVLDSESTYLAGGGFLPDRMLQFWEEKARAGHEIAGYAFTRNIGDMSWAHRKRPGVEELINYESQLNRIIANVPQVNLCLYDLTRCSGELILDVLKTHPKALLGSMVIDNPYYLEPDEFLAAREGAPLAGHRVNNGQSE
jgi:hypothetical protein